jgi:prevent-host-death family protein
MKWDNVYTNGHSAIHYSLGRGTILAIALAGRLDSLRHYMLIRAIVHTCPRRNARGHFEVLRMLMKLENGQVVLADVAARENSEEIQYINARLARVKFRDFIDQARLEEKRTVVTEHGRPAAALVPLKDLQVLKAIDDRRKSDPTFCLDLSSSI